MKSTEELAQLLENERYRKLDIWKNAAELSGMIYQLTKSFPKEEAFGLASQLQRASVSVPSNIAEGSMRSPTEFKNFLRYALGSLAECDTQLLIAEAQGYAPYPIEIKGKIASLLISIRAFSRTL